MAGCSFARSRAFGLSASLSFALTGCNAQSPLAPDAPGAAALPGPLDKVTPPAALVSAAAQPKAKARFVFRFDMLDTAMTLLFADGSTLEGTYRGVATNPVGGQPRATLDGVITGGTGAFTGASGTFSGTGAGGFSGDGEFSVSLRGDVTRSGRKPLDLRVTLKGMVASTCTTDAPPRLFLDGTGAAKGLGAVVGHLEHNLGTDPCAVIIID